MGAIEFAGYLVVVHSGRVRVPLRNSFTTDLAVAERRCKRARENGVKCRVYPVSYSSALSEDV